jgi:cytochrome c2
MKRFIYTAVILMAVFFISRCSQPRPAVFNQAVLQFQKFEIDISKDTILQTAGGIMVQIKAGSLSSSNGNKVMLQIKEALQLADMIKARLTTTANGELLSSGDMFFIEPEDKSVQIVSTLSVYVPADFIDKDNNIYKGTETDGKINWDKPEPVQIPEPMNKYANGEELFKLNCIQCHSIDKKVVGPSLDHITKRRNAKWLDEFTTSAQKYLNGFDFKQSTEIKYDSTGSFICRTDRVIPTNDTAASGPPDFYFYYSHCLFNEYNKTVMPAFKFTPEEMHQLYDYIENESERLRLPMPEDKLFHCVDSCLKYNSLKMELESKRNELIKENGNLVKAENIITLDTGPGFKNRVTPTKVAAKYYQVNIKTFGWYNIDILLMDVNGVKNSNLVVRIRGAYEENISLFLVIPSHKVFVEGGKLSTSDESYVFFKEDGTTPLPQGQTIYVFAAGEAEGKFIFGNSEFIAAAEQTITIEPKEVSKEVFDAAIEKMSAGQMEVSLDKTKNADKIREVEKSLSNIEKLKPKNCDCNCAFGSGEAARDVIELYQ